MKRINGFLSIKSWLLFMIKSSSKKYFYFLLSFLLPFHFVYASWYNPFSWVAGAVTSFARDVLQSLLIFVTAIIDIFAGGFAWLMQQVMWLSIGIMNLSIDNFIYDMKDWIDLGVVDAGWKVVSNVANTVFIFSLLFVAIATILGLNYKHYLATIITAAILVNFSLVLTKASIDLSNIVAVGFYNTATEVASSSPSVAKYIETNLDIDTRAEKMAANLGTTTKAASPTDTEEDATDRLLARAWNDLIKDIISIFFYIIAAYVFFNFAILLITRFIILVFLLILSPLAFATYPLPQTRSHIFNKWASSLTNQLLLAPTLMFFFYITVMMAGRIFKGTDVDVTMLGFMVLVGFLLFSLEAAKSLSDSGSNMVTGHLKKGAGVGMGVGVGAAAVAGRNTAGRFGRFAQNRGFGAKIATSNNAFTRRLGQATMSSVDKMSSGSWDMRNTKLGKTAAKNLEINDIYNKKAGFTKLRDQKIDSIASKNTKTLMSLQQQEKKLSDLKEKEAKLGKNESLTPKEQSELHRLSKFDGSVKKGIETLGKIATQQKPSIKEVGKSFMKDGMSGGIRAIGDKTTTKIQKEALVKATKGFEKEIEKEKIESFKKGLSEKKIRKEIEAQKLHENIKTTINSGDAQKIALELSKLAPHEKITALGESGLANGSVQAHLDPRDLNALADKMASGKINLTTNITQEVVRNVTDSSFNKNASKNIEFMENNPKAKYFS